MKIILIYKLERILRSTFDWGRFSRFLEERGCKLVSPNEDLSDTTASGRLKTNILVSFAEYERLKVAEKIQSKILAQAQRGMWGGGFIPYGYSYDRETQQLLPDLSESPIVQRIFERAAALQSVGQIIQELNAEGHRTDLRWTRGLNRSRIQTGQKLFRSDVVLRMIRNPLYRGVVRFGGQEFKGQHAALVSSETWEQANAAIAEAKKSRQPRLRHADKYSNILKGIVCCMTCGTPLFSNASGKARDDGTAYRYYICRQKRDSPITCSLGSVPAKPLEMAVVGFLREMATDEKTMDLLSGRASDLNYKEVRARADLAEANSTLLSLDRKISNCVDVLESGGASGINPELLERIESLRFRKQEILVCSAKAQIEIDALEARACAKQREGEEGSRAL